MTQTYKVRQFSKSFTDRLSQRGELGRVYLYGSSIQIDEDGTIYLVLSSGIRRELTDEEANAISTELT